MNPAHVDQRRNIRSVVYNTPSPPTRTPHCLLRSAWIQALLGGYPLMESLKDVLQKNKQFNNLIKESKMPPVKEQFFKEQTTVAPVDPVQAAINLLAANGIQVQPNGQQPEDKEYSLVEPTIQIAHEDLANGRFYHLEGDDNLDNWVPSVTTQLGVIRMATGFDVYNRNLGHTAPKNTEALGQKGHDTHYFMVPLVYGETVTLDSIRTYILGNQQQSWKWLYKTVDQYAYAIRKNLASFCQFWYEHQPTPVTVEYPILHPDLCFGGRLDLIVEMKKAKNSKKKSRVLIDLKTGNKYNSHTLQNSAYKVGWELMNPDLPIDYIAGLYVTDGYRKDPTYTLHYQNFDYQGFIYASKTWHRENSNVKGELKPSVKKAPPTKFNLYNEKETK